jgi:ribosome-associated protein
METTPPEGRELIDFIAQRLFDKKAEQVQVMDLRGLSDITDFYVVATCQSEPQMRAILSTLSKDLRKAKLKPLGTEYRAGVRWAVLDAGEIMVHLFEEQARLQYDLERLWADAKLESLNAQDYQTEDDQEDDSDAYL